MAINTRKNSVFDLINVLFMFLTVFVTLFPFIFMVSSSLSNPLYVMQNKIFLLPKGLTLFNYEQVFKDPYIFIAYWNTIKYVVVGTAISVVVTMMTAYPLSKKRFTGRNFLLFAFTFTMLFSGGIIPTYLVTRMLGLINTMWAVVLVPAVSIFVLIITKTFLQSIPESLEESAYIDGANDLQIFLSIVVPLSTPIIGTITLFYAVGQWNAYFVPMMYLNERLKYPLQIYLIDLLIRGSREDSFSKGKEVIVATSMKYTVIIVSTLPILVLYPFLQKYFVKGVMIGAIKG